MNWRVPGRSRCCVEHLFLRPGKIRAKVPRAARRGQRSWVVAALRAHLFGAERNGPSRPTGRAAPSSLCARDLEPLAVSLCVPTERTGPPESVLGVVPGTGVTFGYMNWCVIRSFWRRLSRNFRAGLLDRPSSLLAGAHTPLGETFMSQGETTQTVGCCRWRPDAPGAATASRPVAPSGVLATSRAATGRRRAPWRTWPRCRRPPRPPLRRGSQPTSPDRSFHIHPCSRAVPGRATRSRRTPGPRCSQQSALRSRQAFMFS
jgi:hypothetical protein